MIGWLPIAGTGEGVGMSAVAVTSYCHCMMLTKAAWRFRSCFRSVLNEQFLCFGQNYRLWNIFLVTRFDLLLSDSAVLVVGFQERVFLSRFIAASVICSNNKIRFTYSLQGKSGSNCFFSPESFVLRSCLCVRFFSLTSPTFASVRFVGFGWGLGLWEIARYMTLFVFVTVYRLHVSCVRYSQVRRAEISAAYRPVMYNGCYKCMILRDPAVLPLRSNNGGIFPVLSKQKFYTCSTVGYVCMYVCMCVCVCVCVCIYIYISF